MAGTNPELLERDRELGAIEESIRATAAGTGGGLLILQGPAGIGKTALLREAGANAASAGLAVLGATGGELEQDFAYGGVRQLFEPLLHKAPSSERAELVSGAAALAADVLGVGAVGPSTPPADPGAVLHGLYWLTANQAFRQPTLLAVDDAHWADPASVRYLLYLVRRLEGLPVTLIATVRTGDEAVDPEVLVEAASSPLARTLELEALSEGAIAEMTQWRLGESPRGEFVAACAETTGGVPFLVDELLRELSVEGVAPDEAGALRARELVPRNVARATSLRLARSGEAAASVAGTVAVLGRQAARTRMAELAGLSQGVVADAVAGLIQSHILEDAQRPRFAHPMVRTAVYESMSPADRSAAHAEAARLLASEGRDSEEVASHLLLTHPADADELDGVLTAAAAQAMSRGVPESAAAYLRRALEGVTESGPRASLLLLLGRAEALAQDPGAIEHLQQARALLETPLERAQVANELNRILVLSGQRDAARELSRVALEEIDDRDCAPAVELEAYLAATGFYSPQLREEFDRLLPRLREAARLGTPAARPAALLLAATLAIMGEDLDQVPELVQIGLDDGRLLAEQGAEYPYLAQAAGALDWLDRQDELADLADDLVRDAGERGSSYGFLQGYMIRCGASTRAGDLASAEADLRALFEVFGDNELLLAIGVPMGIGYGIEALLERPGLADIAALSKTIPLEPLYAWNAVAGAILQHARGRIRITEGEVAAGIADLWECGETFDAVTVRNPNGFGAWRGNLALALRGDAQDEAQGLAAAELEMAQAAGFPRAIGVALRTLAIVEGGDGMIERLGEAADILATSPASLEHARALVDLGSALRRTNERVASREPLRQGLDLANRCGAERLAARAWDELRSSGAKPRTRRVTGLDALTPTQRRVAGMAASGMSNPEIAQAQFVTLNTVESHMRQIFQKLGISARTELSHHLPEDAESATAT